MQEKGAQKQAKQEKKALSRNQRRKEAHKRNKQEAAATTLKPVKIEAREWERLRAMSYKALQMEQARAKALQAEGGAMSPQEKRRERSMRWARSQVMREDVFRHTVKIEASEWERMRAMSSEALQMEQARAKALQAECEAMSLQERRRERAMQKARTKVLWQKANPSRRSQQGEEIAMRESAPPRAQSRRCRFVGACRRQLGNELFLNPTYDFILPPF